MAWLWLRRRRRGSARERRPRLGRWRVPRRTWHPGSATVEHLASTRDRAAALLLFYAGPRVGELVALDTDDVTTTARKGQLIIRHGKGGKYREIPLHPAARSAVDDWNNERPDWPGADTAPFMLNRRGGRLTDRTVNDTIAGIGEQVGIEDLTPHVLRHTFGTSARSSLIVSPTRSPVTASSQMSAS